MVKIRDKLYSKQGESIYLSISGIIGISFISWMALRFMNQKWVFGFVIPLYLALLSSCLYYTFRPRVFLSELQREVETLCQPDFYLVGLPFGLFATFVVLAHSINSLWPGSFISSNPNNEATLPWILYGVDNVIRAVLLDFGEIYFIDVSGIDHNRTFWLCTIIFSFRTALSLGFVSLILRAWRVVFRT